MEKPFTVPELASRWSCDERKIYDAVQVGTLPAFRLGTKLIRIPISAATEEMRSAVLELKDPATWQIIADRLRRASAGYNGREMVYFYRAGRFVKVGYSGNPRTRTAVIATTTPFDDLELLGTLPGGRAVEQKIHAILRPFHHRHEWFRLTRSIRRAIEEVRT